MDNKKKTRLVVIIGSIILAVLALVTTTYSLFYNEQVASNPEDYSTGLLSIEAKSKSDTISLEGAIPMSDEDGADTDPYIFTIKNNGNVDYKFDIKLLSTSSTTINPQYIKVKIDDNPATTLSSLTNSIIKSNVRLAAKESVDMSLRIWLDINTPNTEIGKTFTSKIVTEGQAVYTESNYDALEGNAKILYDKFNKTTTITNNCNTTEEIDEDNQLIKDPLGNLHYYGQEPNNYIKFNCETYPNTNCETWRIIGVQDGKVKLMRGESIGSYSWDTSDSSINSGNGINEWSQADLMKLLNPGYESEEVGGSLYYNSQSGKCYNGKSNVSISCDFRNIGVKANTRNSIADITYYLGGGNTSSIYYCDVLTIERGINAMKNSTDGINRTTRWIGKISIPYPSDYGYATDLTKCSEVLDAYNSSDNNYVCRQNNWMWYIMTGSTSALSDGLNNAWFVTSHSSFEYNVWRVDSSARVRYGSNTFNEHAIVPVLSLETNVNIDMSHAGSSADPYVINAE